MKIHTVITEGLIQLSMTPETEHEKSVLKSIEGFNGLAEIHHDTEFFRCRGGYIRNGLEHTSSKAEDLSIVIHKGGLSKERIQTLIEIEDEYYKLLDHVESKVEGESRVETAARYIMEAEAGDVGLTNALNRMVKKEDEENG